MRRIQTFSGEHGFLSNFAPSPLAFEGLTYPTVEHAFQAAKTLDPDERREVASQPTPGKAKRAGRKVTLREGWVEYIGYDTMRTLLRIKFADPGLRERLLDTRHSLLVEENIWHDQRWGSCTCGSAQCLPPGTNLLGILLMDIRIECAQHEAAEVFQVR